MSKISKARDIRVEDYFKYPQLSIPLFQRGYVWEDEEIEEFWEDLILGDIQFLGSIILNDKKYNNVTKEGVLEIVDGQQRTISLLVLLAVVSRALTKFAGARKTSYQKNAEKQAEEINRLISERERDDLTKVLRYKLSLPSASDNDALEKILGGKKSGVKNFDKTLEKTETLLNEHLSTKKGPEQKIKTLVQLKNHLLDIKVIEVLVENDEDAYVIFETVNARGADLGAAELIKNYLFQNLPDKQSIQDEWERVRKALAAVNRRGLDMTGFFRYYWISKYKHLSKKALYRGIKDEVRKKRLTPSKMLTEVGEFRKNLEKIYVESFDDWHSSFGTSGTVQPRSHEWFSYKKNLDYFPKSIQYLPIYAALIGNINSIDRNNKLFAELLLAVEKINFVYSYILQLPTNKIDKMLSGIGRNILDQIGKKDTNGIARAVRAGTNEINQLLKKNVTRELVDKFVAQLSWKRSADKSIIYFILISLEYFSNGYSMLLIKDNISLEHVFPKSAERKKKIKDWPELDFDFAELGHGIGNLTLLPVVGGQANSSAGEASFIKKRDSYFAPSPYTLNRYFNGLKKWNGRSIKRRLKIIQDDVWKRWGV